MIANAERLKILSDAAAQAETDAKAEQERTKEDTGIGKKEGRNCFKATRQTEFIQWPATTHSQRYVPCRPGGPKPENANNANKKSDRLCDFKQGNICDAEAGLCDYCGTFGGKCCKLGERANGCSGTEGGGMDGLNVNDHTCVAGISEPVKNAVAAAKGEYLNYIIFFCDVILILK